MTEKSKENRVAGRVRMPECPLYGQGSTLALMTDSEGNPEGSNAQQEKSARKVLRPPVNIKEILNLKDWSPHHSACVTTKRNSMVGLGFMSDEDLNNDGVVDANEKTAAEIASILTGAPYVKSKVDTALDPLTLFGFSNELSDWVEDFIDTGSAYLEVVRKGDKITFIGALAAKDVRIVKQGHNVFFQVQEREGTTKYFSRFGLENKKWLFGDDGPYANATSVTEDDVSEIIFLPEPNNRCKYYGYPSWMAASADIDLSKKSKQYKADFYHNRGVLDFILSVLGTKVDEKDWKEITDKISTTAQAGHNFKNMALNLSSTEATIQVDKLAGDNKAEEQFSKDNEVFANNIVTSHGVPPLLAGILIPGKLGSSNEFLNSLIAFYLLRVFPAQQLIQKTLASTLGDKELSGLDLEPSDFRLRTLTSQINLKGLETLGGMREEATGADRDLDEGLKD